MIYLLLVLGIHLTMNPVMASLYLMNVVLGLIPAHGVIKTDNLLLTGFTCQKIRLGYYIFDSGYFDNG